jgi:Ca-activated chloride channel family protein
MMAASTVIQNYQPCVLMPRGKTQPLALALQDVLLTGVVTPAGARLVVRHIFASAESRPLEVIYPMMLPRDAALRQFVITGKDFSVTSELLPTEEARNKYDDAIDDGHFASLAELYRDGLVNLMVGNIRPGEVVEVKLELLAGVESTAHGFRFRFPFTIAPSYHAKARRGVTEDGHFEIELPEEEFGGIRLPAWHADSSRLHRVDFKLAVDCPGGVQTLASPSHPVMVQMGATRSTIILAVDGDVPNRDLVLDVQPTCQDALVLAGTDAGGDGHGTLVIPSSFFGATESCPRRVVFTLDHSGSMDGIPLTQAKKALLACLSALEPTDSFGLVAFESRVRAFQPVIQPAEQEIRDRAHQFVNAIEAAGGTELFAGLEQAATIIGEAGGDIFLLTDGQVFGTDEIITRFAACGIRVHCLGIGSASQDRFLAQLARQTGGTSRFLTPRERVDMGALELFAALGHPVATDLQIGSPSGAITIQPAPPATVFSGTAAQAFFSRQPAADDTLQLTWQHGGATRHAELPVHFDPQTDADTLHLLCGARLIADLEARVADGETSESSRRTTRRRQRLLEMSLAYGLASQAASLVAVISRAGDRPGLPTTTVVPLGLPEGMTNVSAACAAGPPIVMQALSRCHSAPPTRSDSRSVMGFMVQDSDQFIPSPKIPSDDNEALLIELAGHLLADGGYPGDTLEARAQSSLVLLLAIVELGQTDSLGGLRFHRDRLTHYLTSEQTHLSDDVQEYISLAFQSLEAGKSVQGALTMLPVLKKRRPVKWEDINALLQ